MSRIRVLPPGAAERIAAGEVIERPASVVKELVENSLDAGAQRITVEIEAAGTRLIRVSDDGAGIPAEDLSLAFERFATSKIRGADDLTGVRTYGFRGEALPSIAAVARVEIVTRPRERTDAARMFLSGGEAQPPAAAGRAEGTTVTVEDLFFNTPARRGFLKSPARETAVIVETVQALALAAPGTAFRLTDGGREILWAPPETFEARARRLLGPRLAAHTLLAQGTGEAAEITAVLGTPQVAEARRAHQWFLVNGRPIRSPMLARALSLAYHTLVPDDRTPIGVVSVRVPPADVDVNVHPRKAEVRFVRDRAVFDDVVREVRRALRSAALVHAAGVHAPRAGEAAPAVAEVEAAYAAGPEGAVADREDIAADVGGRHQPAGSAPPSGVSSADLLWSAPGTALPPIRFLGQLARTYIVGEAGGDLVLIDQHAAHERVLYERLLDRRDAGGAASQGLVTPIAVDLDSAEAALLSDLEPALRALGFDVEPFGRAMVRLRAVPAIAAGREPEALFRACLRDLGDDRGMHAGRDLEERLAITTACHTAVRAGDRLDPATMTALLDDLARTRDPYSCFHGRPTIVRVRRGELERWFYRRG